MKQEMIKEYKTKYPQIAKKWIVRKEDMTHEELNLCVDMLKYYEESEQIASAREKEIKKRKEELNTKIKLLNDAITNLNVSSITEKVDLLKAIIEFATNVPETNVPENSGENN